MSIAAPNPSRKDQDDFARANIRDLSAEILAWRKTGLLRQDGVVKEFANRYFSFSDDIDRLGLAELAITSMAMKCIVDGMASPSA